MFQGNNSHSVSRSDKPMSTADKIVRYNWAELGDSGEFRLVPKEDLKVDHKYQRDANLTKVKRLASRLDWRGFGVLIVMRRASGALYVVEGQHRKLAADLRDDIDRVPCLIFDSTGAMAEAPIFILTNADRKPVSAVAKFKAAIVAKQPGALAVQALVDKTNRTISSNTGAVSIACVKLLVDYFEGSDGPIITKLWPLLIALCEGRAFHDRLVQSLVYIDKHLPEGESLTDKRWEDRLLKIGGASLAAAMTSAQAFYAKGGARVWASGVVNRINKGLSRNKLVLDANSGVHQELELP